MIVSTIANATVLVPNKEHKNFTETNEVIPISTTLVGTFKKIAGERRGKPFDYRIFVTDDKKIIYANTLSSQPKETESPKQKQPVSEGKINTSSPLLYVAIGAGVGYYISRRKSKEFTSQSLIYTLGGAALGYLASKTLLQVKISSIQK